MNAIAAYVTTASGGKYVRQLSNHWGHKLPVDLDSEDGRETGTVTFPSAVVTMTGDAQGIAIAITGEDRADVERLTDVVARHIDRFAFREAPLRYDWRWGGESAAA